MNKTRGAGSRGQWRVSRKEREVDAEGRGAGREECVPLSVRKARQMRRDFWLLWPHLWMSFAAIIILAAALAILSYRIGAQSCH
jgi:hypothetical protein